MSVESGVREIFLELSTGRPSALKAYAYGQNELYLICVHHNLLVHAWLLASLQVLIVLVTKHFLKQLHDVLDLVGLGETKLI